MRDFSNELCFNLYPLHIYICVSAAGVCHAALKFSEGGTLAKQAIGSAIFCQHMFTTFIQIA